MHMWWTPNAVIMELPSLRLIHTHVENIWRSKWAFSSLVIIIIPRHHLVWYDGRCPAWHRAGAVVPCHHLVWYDPDMREYVHSTAVVPCHHLVWYDNQGSTLLVVCAVVPCHHLVWYDDNKTN